MDHLADRPHFHPSGKIDWSRCCGRVPLLAGAALLAGLLLELLLLYVFYVGLFFALFAGLIIGGAMRWFVHAAHIRHRGFAVAVGLVAAALAYFSYFHCDQCLRRGHSWLDVANLPDYVSFRMQTDELINHGKGFEVRPAPAGQVAMQQLPGDQRLNWLVFAAELTIMFIVSGYFSLKAAGTPYSERRGRWLECARVVCRQETLPELLAALRHRRLPEWALRPLIPVAPGEPQQRIAVWYCPLQSGEEPEWLVYLNIGDLKYVELDPEEAAALLPIFPGLLELVFPDGARHVEATPRVFVRGAAQISKVPEPNAGSLLTPFNAVLINVLLLAFQMIPLGLLGLHIGLMGILVRQVGNAIDGTVLAIWAVLGALLPLLALRWLTRAHARSPVSTRYYRWLFRRQLTLRPDALVAADDPRAIFVEYVPRRQWAKIALENAADMGFLLVDDERRELRFEGDRERWQIPGDAVTRCAIELMPSPTNAADGMYVVVVRGQGAEGEWELPIVPRTGLGIDHAQRSEKLLTHLLSLRSPQVVTTGALTDDE